MAGFCPTHIQHTHTHIITHITHITHTHSHHTHTSHTHTSHTSHTHTHISHTHIHTQREKNGTQIALDCMPNGHEPVDITHRQNRKWHKRALDCMPNGHEPVDITHTDRTENGTNMY